MRARRRRHGRLGFRAQEDFARAFKSALGKDAIAIRWCMGPFSGALDLTAFAFSDAIDICVPQPTYETRRPAMVMDSSAVFVRITVNCPVALSRLSGSAVNASS